MSDTSKKFRKACKLLVSAWLPVAMFGCLSTKQHSTLYGAAPDLSATEIVERAHEAAGGLAWSRPNTLSMRGYAVFYDGTQAVTNDSHKMWRVYDPIKTVAHQADGKVRIRSSRNGQVILNLSFDGQTTYTDQGAQPQSDSDRSWSSNFGYGVIRHALDDGYTLTRLADDLVDAKPSYVVRITDTKGGHTLFGIDQASHAIVKVAFDTPRGWHERIYSDFYSNPNHPWQQPGRARLYYNGVKSNEVIWTSFAIDEALPGCLFILPQSNDCKM